MVFRKHVIVRKVILRTKVSRITIKCKNQHQNLSTSLRDVFKPLEGSLAWNKNFLCSRHRTEREAFEYLVSILLTTGRPAVTDLHRHGRERKTQSLPEAKIIAIFYHSSIQSLNLMSFILTIKIQLELTTIRMLGPLQKCELIKFQSSYQLTLKQRKCFTQGLW